MPWDRDLREHRQSTWDRGRYLDGALAEHNTLVCTDCGYLEFYVEDEAKLAKLKEKFGKVEN